MKLKILKIIATALASVTGCGALIYYNFIDKAVAGLNIGSLCPDFTVDTYEVQDGTFLVSEKDFTLSENFGKIVVVNFWETWCTGCIEELPHFDEIAKKYPTDQVEVLAVVGQTYTLQGVADWMNEKGWTYVDEESEWSQFSLTFANYDETGVNLYSLLGGSGGWPRTVIIDQKGNAYFETDASMTYEDLETVVKELLQQGGQVKE